MVYDGTPASAVAHYREADDAERPRALNGRAVYCRARAGTKLGVMLAAGVASVLLDHWWQVLVALGVVLGGYAVARIPARMAVLQVRPLVWMVGLIALFHVLSGSRSGRSSWPG